MVAVKTDPGEALFERYLKANGAGEPAQLVGAADGPRVDRSPVRRLAGQLHS